MAKCKTCDGTGKYDGTPEGMRWKCVDCHCTECDCAPCECTWTCWVCLGVSYGKPPYLNHGKDCLFARMNARSKDETTKEA